VPGAWHGFLKLNDQSSLALVQLPAVGDIAPQMGVTHSGNGASASAPGTLQHLAFNVDTLDDLLVMRDRIRSRGVHVMGHIDHGMCKSIYFAGPENLTLEVSTSEGGAIDAEAWIDPEVVRLAGISDDELARYKAPASYARPAAPVPQPIDRHDGPQLFYPQPLYDHIMATPDDVILKRASYSEPPVKIPA